MSLSKITIRNFREKRLSPRRPECLREPTGVLQRKSAVYGLNGHRLYYIISLIKAAYKSTIQVSRNFHALFLQRPSRIPILAIHARLCLLHPRADEARIPPEQRTGLSECRQSGGGL